MTTSTKTSAVELWLTQAVKATTVNAYTKWNSEREQQSLDFFDAQTFEAWKTLEWENNTHNNQTDLNESFEGSLTSIIQLKDIPQELHQHLKMSPWKNRALKLQLSVYVDMARGNGLYNITASVKAGPVRDADETPTNRPSLDTGALFGHRSKNLENSDHWFDIFEGNDSALQAAWTMVSDLLLYTYSGAKLRLAEETEAAELELQDGMITAEECEERTQAAWADATDSVEVAARAGYSLMRRFPGLVEYYRNELQRVHPQEYLTQTINKLLGIKA